jgi:hypothetical protein
MQVCCHDFGVNISPHSDFIMYNISQAYEAADATKFKITYCQILEISSGLCKGQFHVLSFIFIGYIFTFNTPQLLTYFSLF